MSFPILFGGLLALGLATAIDILELHTRKVTLDVQVMAWYIARNHRIRVSEYSEDFGSSGGCEECANDAELPLPQLP